MFNRYILLVCSLPGITVATLDALVILWGTVSLYCDDYGNSKSMYCKRTFGFYTSSDSCGMVRAYAS